MRLKKRKRQTNKTKKFDQHTKRRVCIKQCELAAGAKAKKLVACPPPPVTAVGGRCACVFVAGQLLAREPRSGHDSQEKRQAGECRSVGSVR